MLAFPYGLVRPKLGFSVIIRKQSDRQAAVFPQTSGRGSEDGVSHTQGKRSVHKAASSSPAWYISLP